MDDKRTVEEIEGEMAASEPLLRRLRRVGPVVRRDVIDYAIDLHRERDAARKAGRHSRRGQR